jgi:hypothetical protein
MIHFAVLLVGSFAAEALVACLVGMRTRMALYLPESLVLRLA